MAELTGPQILRKLFNVEATGGDNTKASTTIACPKCKKKARAYGCKLYKIGWLRCGHCQYYDRKRL